MSRKGGWRRNVRAAAREDLSERVGGPVRRHVRLVIVTAVICAALLAGAGSAGVAQKSSPSRFGLPTTQNACSTFGRGITCKWDLKIVADVNYVVAGQGSSQEMHASWQVTYKNLLLGLPDASELALSIKEPEGDIIRMQGGGQAAKSITSGAITYSQTQVAPAPSCSWTKSYTVPTVLRVNSYLKLRKPIRGGLPWSFGVLTYYDRTIGRINDNCKPGNTEVVGLGMPESTCCRLGGPPITEVFAAYVFYSTDLHIYYLTKLGRLPYPWMNFWKGRSFRLRKIWKTAQNDDGTTWSRSGSVTASFVRRR
jgi:hypothetical protein